ncbi:MAG: autotransporter-associated beta strand repeat-containing protein [Chthoniobacterales bacterium]
MIYRRIVLLFLALFVTQAAFAGSATWNLNPTSGEWSTDANWTPATYPNSATDTATFAQSSITNISTPGAPSNLDGIVFTPDASAFTISLADTNILLISGAGIINNSGKTQQFNVPNFDCDFLNGATAGENIQYVIKVSDTQAGGMVFFDSAGAGQASYFIEPSQNQFVGDGLILFAGDSTADRGTFTISGGAVNPTIGGVVTFLGNSTAGAATFNALGSTLSGTSGGRVFFEESSNAGDATLIAAGGSGGGAGGLISFERSARGTTGRVEVFGNGSLDISGVGAKRGQVVIGSLEGSGNVFLGANQLSVGSNGLSTKFSGVLADSGGQTTGTGGSLAKVGSGKLFLRNANFYTGGTTVESGILIVSNTEGSVTGSGPVQVNGGMLVGKGVIAGAVKVGTGSGTGAIFSPGFLGGKRRPGLLTIQGALSFSSDGTYQAQVNSTTEMADEVSAFGVTIEPAAQFVFSDIGSGLLPQGTVFRIIDNTATNPISGTFANLTDGQTIIQSGNTYKANYEGGDGNDLTLTVQ